jgi:1-acyl-sn-glycerol-3-phosphate acyltransferase
VKRFHARLFGPAIDSGVPVQPVMLRYLQAGRPYPGITFLPGEHFMDNFLRLLRQPPCTAEVKILLPIEPADKLRRQLATEATAQSPAPQPARH